MSKFADKITNYIMNKGIIDPDDYDIYHYGFQTGIELIICLTVSAIIAGFMDLFIEYVVVLSVLLPLRAYVCGIHMERFVSCFLCSVILVTCGPYVIQKVLINKEIMLALSIVVMIILHNLSHITTKAQCDSDEVRFFTIQRKRILIYIFILQGVFFLISATECMKQALYALFVVLFSVLAQVLLIKINKRTTNYT